MHCSVMLNTVSEKWRNEWGEEKKHVTVCNSGINYSKLKPNKSNNGERVREYEREREREN